MRTTKSELLGKIDRLTLDLLDARQQLAAMTAKAELYERALWLAANCQDQCPAVEGYDAPICDLDEKNKCQYTRGEIDTSGKCWCAYWLEQAEQAENMTEVADNGN